MNKFYLFLGLSFCVMQGCVTFAPPPPMATMGGPKTTPHKSSEAVLAFGTGAALFEKGHTGAQGWFGRYKYGLSDKLDIGADVIGAKRNEGLLLSLKGAGRYQLTKNTRLELGLGVADDSSGKSINCDLGYTFGTVKDKPWNYYSTLRVGYTKGVASNAITLPNQTKGIDSIPPPNTTFAMLNLGAEGKISPNQTFIFEGGYGHIFPNGEQSGPAFYLSAGLKFIIGNKED